MNQQPVEALAQVLKAVSSASSPISKPWRRYALRRRIFATRSGVLCHRTRAS
ncbi:hypothetical protein [Pandoraea apista]|uniref:hypothetical protein n=1 Tax=Pandoraea apista TaxID=93218 RepID=UPI001553BBE9|nr:hypothetical protein [Pandoraea apista]